MEQEQRIHWDSENPKQLDLEYYESIGKLSKMILWGGFIIAIIGLAGVFTTAYGVLGIIAILMRSILIGILCVKSYKALTTRKGNAIYLTRSLVWFCFISWILSCMVNLFFSNILQVFNLSSLIWLAGCIAGLVYSYSDGEISEVFPKSFRHHSRFDFLLVLAAWIIPNALEFVGGFMKALTQHL